MTTGQSRTECQRTFLFPSILWYTEPMEEMMDDIAEMRRKLLRLQDYL
jgi:hypothetical protein